jgi:hypothetical protein
MSRICCVLSDGALGWYQSEDRKTLQLFIPIQSLLRHGCRHNKLCREATIPGDTTASYCKWELGLSVGGGVERSLPRDLHSLDLDLDLNRSPTPAEVQY